MMQCLKYLLITAVLLALVTPDDAWPRIRIRIRKAWNKIKKFVCKAVFGIVCPAGVKLGAAYVNRKYKVPPQVVAAGSRLAKKGCSVIKKKKCKRSIQDNDYELIPFSDNFDNYDLNGDKMIEYDEFRRAVTFSVGMTDPDQLMEPFVFADANDDDMIDTDEFQGAPFVFGHEYADVLYNTNATKTNE